MHNDTCTVIYRHACTYKSIYTCRQFWNVHTQRQAAAAAAPPTTIASNLKKAISFGITQYLFVPELMMTDRENTKNPQEMRQNSLSQSHH